MMLMLTLSDKVYPVEKVSREQSMSMTVPQVGRDGVHLIYVVIMFRCCCDPPI